MLYPIELRVLSHFPVQKTGSEIKAWGANDGNYFVEKIYGSFHEGF